MRVEDTMTKLIRIIVAGLSLCGAVAVLPGVAEARENDRPAPAHVEHDRRGEHGRPGERGHGEHVRPGERGHEGRWDHARWHDARGRFEHGRRRLLRRACG
jgi:hypothetical protein